jgi:peptidoglycan/LPS O-acetylase OafA/YrhL
VIAGYREDIDWLRAIAVLSVVAFHFEVPPAYGGYVGVDIFFVISGYLISGIIQSEIKADRFSFARFYERRVRRLLPALYAMVALTAIPAFHYLLTTERAEFFRSVAAVVTFTSNFFFYFQAGYFDHAAVEKPLLHTWSLAVEEQFYLALPVLLFAVMRSARGSRIALPVTLGALTLISFAFAVYLMRNDAAANAFFMSPPRAWEFLIGSIAALPGVPLLRHVLARSAVRALALVLLAIAVFGLRKESPFPGLNALLPCIGAALFIWAGIGVPTRLRGRYSPFNLAKFFGQISYSLYLWHWPLFTFARFSKASLTLGPGDKVALFALTVAISYLSWRYVERPFRERRLAPTRVAAFGLAGVSSILLLAAGAAGYAVSRTPAEADRMAAQLETYNNADRYKPSYRFGECFMPASGTFGEACLAVASSKTNVLLWGDSYAAQYYDGLHRNVDPARVNILQATEPACMPTLDAAAQFTGYCRSFATQMQAFLASHKVDLVIMAGDWLEYSRPPHYEGMIADLKKTIAALTPSGTRVVLAGPAVQFRSELPSMLIRAHLRGVEARADDFVLPDIFDLDEKMRAALPDSEQFTYLSVLDAACPARQCPLMLGGGVPIAWDHAHLTTEGSAYVMGKLVPRLGLDAP